MRFQQLLRKLYPALNLAEKCADDKPYAPTLWFPRRKLKVWHQLHSSGGEPEGHCGKLEGEELCQFLTCGIYWLAMQINDENWCILHNFISKCRCWNHICSNRSSWPARSCFNLHNILFIIF
ncbi:unnamed protein product, partial [Vitis vinifera]|uniref:Uncharacterized protein n=1 Tax=Vitis vinifera TaxID=29760 RepID=D7UCY7_VITVI